MNLILSFIPESGLNLSVGFRGWFRGGFRREINREGFHKTLYEEKKILSQKINYPWDSILIINENFNFIFEEISIKFSIYLNWLFF